MSRPDLFGAVDCVVHDIEIRRLREKLEAYEANRMVIVYALDLLVRRHDIDGDIQAAAKIALAKWVKP